VSISITGYNNKFKIFSRYVENSRQFTGSVLNFCESHRTCQNFVYPYQKGHNLEWKKNHLSNKSSFFRKKNQLY